MVIIWHILLVVQIPSAAKLHAGARGRLAGQLAQRVCDWFQSHARSRSFQHLSAPGKVCAILVFIRMPFREGCGGD